MIRVPKIAEELQKVAYSKQLKKLMQVMKTHECCGGGKAFFEIIFKATFNITKFAKGFKAFSLTILHLETQ